jgi:ABC-type phosphate/phosphonate transport system substrate-binding protein
VGTPANPLVIVLSPAHVPPAGPLAAIKKHLEEATGLSVELTPVPSPGAAVGAFASGRTDAGLLTLEEYLVAREEYGVRAGLQALRADGQAGYEGVLLARAGGPQSVAELAGEKVGFVGPYSVSGFTLPVIFLEKAGVKAQPYFAAAHPAALKLLLDGQVAAVATYARQARRVPGLKVLAVTGQVPNEPVVFRKGLSAEKAAALQSALVSLARSKAGAKALGAVADITGFKPVDEDVYKPLHELLRGEGRTVYDLVPEGWDIYRLNQPFSAGLQP